MSERRLSRRTSRSYVTPEAGAWTGLYVARASSRDTSERSRHYGDSYGNSLFPAWPLLARQPAHALDAFRRSPLTGRGLPLLPDGGVRLSGADRALSRAL